MHNKITINNTSNSDNSDVPQLQQQLQHQQQQLLLLLSSQTSMSSYNKYHCNNTIHTSFVQAKCTSPHHDHIKRLIVKLLSIFGIHSILKRHRKFFRRKARYGMPTI